MAKIVERTPERMVLQSGSTTLLLDKLEGAATLHRKVLFMSRKPLSMPLANVRNVTVDAAVDRASGIEMCNTMLVTGEGAAWALAAEDRAEAERTAADIRAFLGV